MSKTSVATSSNLAESIVVEKLFRDMKKQSYFSRFMGGSDKVVYEKTDLTKKKGDTLYFGIRMRVTNSGVTSNQALEGNEESLTFYNHTLTLEEYAHAVRDDGPLTRQRTPFDMDAEAKMALQDWGSEKIDQLLFDAMHASPTKQFYGGDATSTATIDSADTITPAVISKMRAWATTGGARSQTPLRPIMVDGRKYWILIVHPDVMYDLKQDSTFAQARREAEVRGKENPIFSGASAIWDGVVIHEHENSKIVTTYGASSNVPGAQCSLVGAQALVWGWGKRPKLVSEEFDYGREHGHSIQMIGKASKPVFNSLDYGVVALHVARTQISDA